MVSYTVELILSVGPGTVLVSFAKTFTLGLCPASITCVSVNALEANDKNSLEVWSGPCAFGKFHGIADFSPDFSGK